jgi:hypothetical protein
LAAKELLFGAINEAPPAGAFDHEQKMAAWTTARIAR